MHRSCQRCGKGYEAQRSTSVYCSASCRASAGKARAKGRVRPAAVQQLRPDVAVASVEAATRVELGDEFTGSAVGQQALLIARRLDAGVDTSGSAVASLSKQLTVLLGQVAAARAEQVAEDDPVARARAAVVLIRERFAAS